MGGLSAQVGRPMAAGTVKHPVRDPVTFLVNCLQISVDVFP